MITTIIIQVFIPIILGSVIFLIGYFYGKKVQRKFEIEKDEFYHSKHYKDFIKSWNDNRGNASK